MRERVSEEDGRTGGGGGRSGYRTKNKNPTRQCGEKNRAFPSPSPPIYSPPIYIDGLAFFLVVLLYASMIWMVHK